MKTRTARRHVIIAVGFTYIGMAIGLLVGVYAPRELTGKVDTANVESENIVVYTPTPEPPAVLPGRMETVKISYYRPELGGVNCSRFVNGECISRMASGERWQDWYGRAAACPKEWPFWTTVVLPGGESFFCLDRGGAIRYGADGLTFIDLLVRESPVPFGTRIEVRVIHP